MYCKVHGFVLALYHQIRKVFCLMKMFYVFSVVFSLGLLARQMPAASKSNTKETVVKTTPAKPSVQKK
jgi:hypothetical protein